MRILKTIALIVFVAYLLSGIHQIRAEERAVVSRFGKIIARPGPGLWIGFPWGIDRVDRVSIAKVRRITFGYNPTQDDRAGMPVGQLLTGDENLVNVQIHLDYAVAEGDDALVSYVLQRDQVEQVIVREAEAVLVEWITSQSVDEVLLTGSRVLPDWLVERTQQRIEQYHLGVRVQQASVAHLAPPDEVRPAFEAVNQAEINARTMEQRARQEEAQRLRDAEGTRYQLNQMAMAYADGKRVAALAEAKAFEVRLEQYQRLVKQNPEILVSIWWDEMGKTLMSMKGRGRIDLLDDHLGPDGLDISQIVPPGKRK